MEWALFEAWRDTMRRQVQGRQAGPDSWDGAQSDPWWTQQWRDRAEKRRL